MRTFEQQDTETQAVKAIQELAGELQDLKRLLVLLLLKGGSTGSEIARALGVDKSTVSRNYHLAAVEPFLIKSKNGDNDSNTTNTGLGRPKASSRNGRRHKHT